MVDYNEYVIKLSNGWHYIDETQNYVGPFENREDAVFYFDKLLEYLEEKTKDES